MSDYVLSDETRAKLKKVSTASIVGLYPCTKDEFQRKFEAWRKNAAFNREQG